MLIVFFVNRCNSKCMELISEDAMKSTIQFINKLA